MPKSIFIYDPDAAGHHAGFLRVLLAAFQQSRDWRTTLLTSKDARSHPAFKRLADDFRNVLDMVVARHVDEPPLLRRLVGGFYAGQYANAKSLRREFKTLNEERQFDFALIPYMEAVGVHSLALRAFFGRVPWAVIPHGLRFHFRESGIKSPRRRIDAMQRACFFRMLRAPTLHRVFALDPYLVSSVMHPKVVYVPDPSSLPLILDRRVCRRSLDLPESAIVLLVYGAIDGRKCLDLLIPAIARVDPALNVLLVIAGVQDQRLRKTLLMEGPATQLRGESRLVEFNRFVTTEEEQMLFTAADIVWNYNRDSYGSSGVLVRAGQYSKPVIVSDLGLAGRIVTDERCGVVVASPDPAAIAQAIVELATQPALREVMAKRAFARFAQNVPEAFAGPIVDAIEGGALARRKVH